MFFLRLCSALGIVPSGITFSPISEMILIFCWALAVNQFVSCIHYTWALALQTTQQKCHMNGQCLVQLETQACQMLLPNVFAHLILALTSNSFCALTFQSTCVSCPTVITNLYDFEVKPHCLYCSLSKATLSMARSLRIS